MLHNSCFKTKGAGVGNTAANREACKHKCYLSYYHQSSDPCLAFCSGLISPEQAVKGWKHNNSESRGKKQQSAGTVV